MSDLKLGNRSSHLGTDRKCWTYWKEPSKVSYPKVYHGTSSSRSTTRSKLPHTLIRIFSHLFSAILHPAIDSCLQVQLERYFTVFRFMVPVYSALHFIPMLVLRFKHVRRDPMGMLAKAGWGTVRSSSFLSVFVMIYLGEWINFPSRQQVTLRSGADGYDAA